MTSATVMASKHALPLHPPPAAVASAWMRLNRCLCREQDRMEPGCKAVVLWDAAHMGSSL